MTFTELKQRAQWTKAYGQIYDFFQCPIKASVWMCTMNPVLGATPVTMIRRGRGRKLLKWIKTSLEENKR